MSEPLPYEPSMLRRRRHVLPLPAEDAVIDDMAPDFRATVGATWRRRAHEELKVSGEFSVLFGEIVATGAPPEVLSSVSRAIHDEVRHAEVLRALASRYLREAVPWPDGAIAVKHASPHVDLQLRAVFHAVEMCCVVESIASVFLERSLADTRSPSARVAVGDLLADEVLHARVGWTYLASQPAPMRALVEEHQLTLISPGVRTWWEQGRVTLVEGAPEHGIPSVTTVRECTLAAMRDVVLPGFVALGIDVSPTREWLSDPEAALGSA